MLSCELVDGIINTKVTDLGLFTDSINLKYKDDILAKARALITTTICNTIFKTIRDRVNRVLHKLPSFLSVSDILLFLFGKLGETEECLKNGFNMTTTTSSLNKLLDFLDLTSLKRLLINLEFLDSSAGVDYFSVGLMGDALVAKNRSEEIINKLNNFSQTSINNDNDLLFTSENPANSILQIDDLFDDNLQNITISNVFINNFEWRREGSMEIIFSQQIANNLLLKAFRANLLSISVGQNSPLFGPLLRTSCDLDNVCLGDSMPEASEIYPNEQLELKILPTEAPTLNFTEDLGTLSLSGIGIFFLARERFGQPIARIPFFTLLELNIGMENASLTIPKLEILESADFFKVPATTLQQGFGDSIRNAIINFATKFLNISSGLDFLNILGQKLCHWGISSPKIKLLNNGFVILSIEELNVYKLFRIDSDDFNNNFSIKNSFNDSKCFCC
uniref:BPI2 domain-containing protein n=1 Tax=Meloidogyne hapla TaxID=6305 RepID=A0A1I8BJS9_MELHA